MGARRLRRFTIRMVLCIRESQSWWTLKLPECLVITHIFCRDISVKLMLQVVIVQLIGKRTKFVELMALESCDVFELQRPFPSAWRKADSPCFRGLFSHRSKRDIAVIKMWVMTRASARFITRTPTASQTNPALNSIRALKRRERRAPAQTLWTSQRIHPTFTP